MSVPDIPLAIIGPTAAGKSALAMAIAAVDDRVELISADSMQVYRGMDIGTAKPSRDEQAAVPHHLIDILDPWDAYTVSQFVVDVDRVTADIRSRGKIPVMVGGTGLYVRSIVDDMEIPPQFPDVKAELEADPDTDGMHRRLAELDPVGAERMDSNNRRRVIRALEVTVGSGRPFSSFGPGMDRYKPSRVNQIACDRPRPSLDERIHRRYDVQMERGFLEEVRAVASHPNGMSANARQALGYKELLGHIEGGQPLEMALDIAKQRTRRFVRRQHSWFRRDPRIEWFDLDAVDVGHVVERVLPLLQ
ncbi:tRNA (adenosine(37)-N6)-dimethylallyltransferase MiaA [Acidimicrobiaceae bacterium]|nr:tRNA (adenosine(37)-N6)-dimethylallyltransferase MiaA [Acidimicrobiaceae bacterium]MDB4109982.1 tRNA (adenosine(37)-N6)-dimethylallyltransferase MiaA [bacterium]